MLVGARVNRGAQYPQAKVSSEVQEQVQISQNTSTKFFLSNPKNFKLKGLYRKFEFSINYLQPGQSSFISKSFAKKDLFQWATTGKNKTFFTKLEKTHKRQQNIMQGLKLNF